MRILQWTSGLDTLIVRMLIIRLLRKRCRVEILALITHLSKLIIVSYLLRRVTLPHPQNMLRLWLNKILIHSYYHFRWVRWSPSIRGTYYRLFEMTVLDCMIWAFIWTASALLQTPLRYGLSAHFIYNFILKSDSSWHACGSSTTINLAIMRDTTWRCSKFYCGSQRFNSNRPRLLM